MISIPHEKYTLSNGLDVIVHEDHSIPMTAVNLWYHVGSKDEEVGRTGFAHLFEHMMFEGSKNHNKLFFEPLQKVGANLNGSTTSDRTNYWETVPSNYLELALWLESDRMGFLLDALDQKRFDVQRDVVKNERRQSYENRPYGQSHLLLQPALFPAPHPYSWPVIGSQEDLTEASLEDVKDFFRRYYGPGNASLAIAGDIDFDETKTLVEKYFGDITPIPAVNRIGRMESGLRGEARLDLRDRVQLPRVYLVWPGPPMFDDDEPALDILSTVLSDGKTSRLHKLLVYEKQIARDVSVGSYTQEIAGEIHIQVTASPGNEIDEIVDLVEAEIDRLRSEPPTDIEVQGALNRIESQHTRQLEHVGSFGGRADQLNHYNVFGGDPGLINTDLDRYKSVTPTDVSRVVSRYLGPDRVRLEVLPAEETSAADVSIDRSVMPEGGPERSFTPPVPKRDKLENGLNILYVEKPGLPLTALGLTIGAGGTTDPANQPGLAQMTAAMLAEGTASRSSQEIAAEIEFLGARLDADASREQVMISAEALSDHWPKVLEIMADVTQNPTFPDHELERLRKERLADLRRISDDPMAVSQRASRALLYGPESKYGHPLNGTESSVEQMTRQQVVDHFETYYGPDGATLMAVGDITGEELVSKARELFGGWTKQQASPTAATDGAAMAIGQTTIFLANKPGAAQSVIRAGHLTVPRHHKDYHPLNMINYVFGGQATARLFMNLRQDKGYSYGYYSNIEWLTGQSSLFAGGSVQTEVTKESVIETLKEFADIRGDRPVTDEEFKSAKDGMFRGFPAQFETQGQVLHQLGRLVLFDLPDDYYTTLIPNLEALTLDDLHRVAGSRIDDGHLVLLVVGDREAIEPGLQELGHPIVHVSAEGHPED